MVTWLEESPQDERTIMPGKGTTSAKGNTQSDQEKMPPVASDPRDTCLVELSYRREFCPEFLSGSIH